MHFKCKNTRNVGNVEKYTNYSKHGICSNICRAKRSSVRRGSIFFLNDVPETMNLFTRMLITIIEFRRVEIKKYITVTVKRQTLHGVRTPYRRNYTLVAIISLIVR